MSSTTLNFSTHLIAATCMAIITLAIFFPATPAHAERAEGGGYVLQYVISGGGATELAGGPYKLMDVKFQPVIGSVTGGTGLDARTASLGWIYTVLGPSAGSIIDALISSLTIERVDDAPGSGVRIRWSAPTGSVLSVLRRVGPFANAPADWASIPGLPGSVVAPAGPGGIGSGELIDSTDAGVIRQGAPGVPVVASEVYYRLAPAGADFASLPAVGRIDVPLPTILPSIPVSYPFENSDSSIQGVFGRQLTADGAYAQADKIQTWRSDGELREAWLNSAGGGTWTSSSLTSVEPGRAYWLDVRPGHPRNPISFVGRVRTGSGTLTLRQGPNFLGWPYVTNRIIPEIGLNSLATARESYGPADKLQTWLSDGSIVEGWYSNTGGGTWLGILDNLEPGRGYWFSNQAIGADETWTFSNPLAP